MMFKRFMTLLRGKAHEAEAALAARQALTILDQQMRESAAAIHAAKRALASAMAAEAAEAQRLAAVTARIAGLEDRARAALAGGREDLAVAAAEVIATLELDRDAARHASATFAQEIARLRAQLQDAERQSMDLQRGRRLAGLSEALRRTRLHGFNPGPLHDAQETLTALRSSQAQEEAAAMAYDRLSPTPGQIEDRLGAAGFGPATRPRVDDILARLRPLALPSSNQTGV